MSVDATQVLPPPTWSDPRIHLLDDTWLLTIFAILLGTALPWLVSGLDVDFVAASLGLLVLGAIHIAFTALIKPRRRRERRAVLTALHIAGLCMVGFVWMNAGGLQNPAFLLVFVLPVVGAIFLSRWQPYLMALVAIVLVGAVALAQAPELRWYVPGLKAAGAWLATAIDSPGVAGNTPFRGFYAPSGYYLVLLQVFSIAVLACAVAAEYLGTIFERLHAHVDVARAEAQSGQDLWATLIEDLPVPAFLVEPETAHIVAASGRAAQLCTTPPASNRSLFDTVRFSYPEVVQQLIATEGGTAPLNMIAVGERLLATEVVVRHTIHKGQRFALVVIHDQTDAFTARTALDLTGQAVLVIDARGRIVAFNKPSQALFAVIERDADAAQLLALAGMPARWWEPGITGRRKMHVEIAPRIYQVTSAATPLPGEEQSLYVVTFLPVARAALGEHTTITPTLSVESPTGSNPTLVSRP